METLGDIVGQFITLLLLAIITLGFRDFAEWIYSFCE
jgi:hypothetical protein